MRIRLATLSVILAAAFLAREAAAWGDIGHGAVGYIAEKNLTPKAKGLVFDILGIEPLATAAVWPDQVRSDDRFKGFSNYHFLEIPMGSTFEDMPDEKRAPQSAHTIIAQVPKLLAGNRFKREQKMVLLRYLIHVVGDVHQPLHVGNGVDMGANLCDVKWTDPQTKITKTASLHSSWDEGLIQNINEEFQRANVPPGGKPKWFGYRELGDLILAENTRQPASISCRDEDIAAWYGESQKLHSVAYPDATPVTDPAERPYCKMVDPVTKKVVDGKYDAAKIPTLDEAYIARATPVIKRQIYLAGLRLAALLNEAANRKHVRKMDDARIAQLLEAIQLKNDDRRPQSTGKAKPAVK